MSACNPFFLYEAEISLYLQDASGQPNTLYPVWFGCCANNINLNHVYEKFRSRASGSAVERIFQTMELHEIEIGRVWALPTANLVEGANASVMREFKPARNQRFVMQFRWHDAVTGFGHQRTYYGVTTDNINLVSAGVLQINAKQVFSAERMEEAPC